ncbi:MAG: hypothetical protein JSV24_00720, partial [Bacteroidales bacterium]
MMKKLFFLFTGLFWFFQINPVLAQDTLFFENFDDYPGTKPPGWTGELEAAPSRIWEFVNGGGVVEPPTPPIPGSRRPPSAYSGAVNALYFYESLGNESIILITPPIDLEFSVKSELRFRHAQMTWNSIFGEHNDELRIYYKTHLDSNWVESKKIAEYTDPVEDWTEQTVLIPPEAFTSTCYFGFKATTKYGWGVCIDDVAIINCDLPIVNATADNTIVCEGESVTLTAEGNADVYYWNNGVIDGVPFFPPVGTTIYILTGEFLSTVCTNTDTIEITVNPLPTVIATADQTSVCDGENVILTGEGANVYTWDNDVINGVPFIPPVGTTTYTVLGTDLLGCSNYSSINITINPEYYF